MKEYLNSFDGVLVSDFYSAYDSLSCKHQKCLIHLIRDFNDDLVKNPFNEEFKEMTFYFTKLLQSIIKTVDRCGLKKRYLSIHKDKVALFFTKLLNAEYRSEITKSYKARILKYKESLFQFIDHDDVSWNNSIAEHAIKLLSTHTNKTLFFYRSKTLEEYLIILSIYQTCCYNEISFLKFLLSKEKNIIKYVEKRL